MDAPSKSMKAYKQYKKLSKKEQFIVELLVVCCNQINRFQLQDLISHAGVYKKKWVKDEPVDIGRLLELLEQKNITIGYYGEYYISYELMFLIFSELAKEPEKLDEKIKAVRSWRGGSYSLNNESIRFESEFYYSFFTQDRKMVVNNVEAIISGHAPFKSDDNYIHDLFPSYFQQYPFLGYPLEFQLSMLEIFMNVGLLKLQVDYDFILKLDTGLGAELHKLGDQKLIEYYRYLKAPFYFFQGDLSILSNYSDFQQLPYLNGIIQASCNLLKNEPDHDNKVLKLYNESISAVRKITKKKNFTIPNVFSAIYLFSLTKNSDAAQLKQARKYKNQFIRANPQFTGFSNSFGSLLDILEKNKDCFIDMSEEDKVEPVSVLFFLLVNHLCGRTLPPFFVDYIHVAITYSQQKHYPYLARQLSLLANKLNPDVNWPDIPESQGAADWSDIFPVKEHWQRMLELISQLKSPTKVISQQEMRLAWYVSFDGWSDRLEGYVKEQKKNAKGVWSKGKKIPLKRLKENGSSLSSLTNEDKGLIDCIEDDYPLAMLIRDRALPLLLKLPIVFDYYSGHLVELQKVDVSLQITQARDEMKISLVPEPDLSELHWQIYEKGPDRYEIAHFDRKQLELYSLLNGQLMIPQTGLPELTQTLEDVSEIIPVLSNIKAISQHSNNQEVESDSSLYLYLTPYEQGLCVEIFIKPLGETGPAFSVGLGNHTIMATVEINDKQEKLHCERNLKLEKNNLKKLKKECPIFRSYQSDEPHIFDEPLVCLELVETLSKLDSEFKLRWPEGEKFKSLTPHSVKWEVSSRSDWFEVKANVVIDEQLTLTMKDLLQQQKSRIGRYLQLSDGQFLALSEHFQKQFDTLSHLGETQDEGYRYNHLMAGIVDEFMSDEEEFKADKKWLKQVNELKNIQQKNYPVPSTLQAELRDYQYQGVQWLARLADWGVGACLADDMGLGKTVQGLALLLMRASQGPALVVAPTSVSLNWVDEILRFSPTLNAKLLFEASDREHLIKNSQPFDVIICSYTLLQSQAELLQSLSWSTVILDEAQAIKNPQAKRSQAAMNLQGDFKLITTGTPIENHLGELWNLFRFINPGLLGSREKFNFKYANPIEKNQDVDAQQRLKRLLQPFILRRNKVDVLTELPAKTEQVLYVELSLEERAIYEAIRLQAIEKMASTEHSQGASGTQHLQILAELTKLRRVCCHPTLAIAKSKIEGSKLKVFAETIQDLIANKHKALVFSQFVTHLSILENHLKANGISYQYLDGSTSSKERKKRLQAFQAGEGDVFLISLKAGGVGLNLTAADYVLHMDPWWNPAVEDQASDRAHRMGQQRPVTVYRLITKNTIEEKIVKLHEHKRDLADSLLSGTDAGNRLSFKEIMQILKEE